MLPCKLPRPRARNKSTTLAFHYRRLARLKHDSSGGEFSFPSQKRMITWRQCNGEQVKIVQALNYIIATCPIIQDHISSE